jgi:hypothetical protein
MADINKHECPEIKALEEKVAIYEEALHKIKSEGIAEWGGYSSAVAEMALNMVHTEWLSFEWDKDWKIDLVLPHEERSPYYHLYSSMIDVRDKGKEAVRRLQ